MSFSQPMLNVSKFFSFYPRAPQIQPVSQLLEGSIEKKEEIKESENEIETGTETGIGTGTETMVGTEIKAETKTESKELEIKTTSIPISAPTNDSKIETLDMNIVISKSMDQIMNDGLGSSLLDSIAISTTSEVVDLLTN